jgi:hypothetical protein
MADRIFPNNINVDMGSKIQFSGIDYDNVQKLMNNNYRVAQESEQEIMDLLRKLEEEKPEIDETDTYNPSTGIEDDSVNIYDGEGDNLSLDLTTAMDTKGDMGDGLGYGY